MTRLSYKKDKKGNLKSNIVFSKKGVAFFATINYSLGEWKIFYVKRRNVIRSGKATNKNYLRQAVRSNLIDLGVVLVKERTEKGYKVTPKEYK